MVFLGRSSPVPVGYLFRFVHEQSALLVRTGTYENAWRGADGSTGLNTTRHSC